MNSSPADLLIVQIQDVFAATEYPGDHAITQLVSEEASETARVFSGRSWQSLSSDLLNREPNGLGSALSFFSPEAFRYFLPAYLIADLRNELSSIDLSYYLCPYLDDLFPDQESLSQQSLEPLLKTMRFDRLVVFNRPECKAVLGYLHLKLGFPIDEDEGCEHTKKCLSLWTLIPLCATPTKPLRQTAEVKPSDSRKRKHR